MNNAFADFGRQSQHCLPMNFLETTHLPTPYMNSSIPPSGPYLMANVDSNPSAPHNVNFLPLLAAGAAILILILIVPRV